MFECVGGTIDDTTLSLPLLVPDPPPFAVHQAFRWEGTTFGMIGISDIVPDIDVTHPLRTADFDTHHSAILTRMSSLSA